MARLDVLCYWISIIASIGFTYSFESSIAYDRPVHTVVSAFTLCALIILSATRLLPNLFQVSGAKAGYEEVPLDELGDTIRSPKNAETSSRVRVSVLALCIIVLSLRIELYRRIVQASECTITSLEVFLPLLISLYDFFRFQNVIVYNSEEKYDSSIYDSLFTRVGRYLIQPRWRYVVPTLVFSYSSFSVLAIRSSINSTYICPTVTGEKVTIPVMQCICLGLDFLLTSVIQEMRPKKNGSGLSARRTAILWNTTLLGTAFVWASIGLIIYFFKPEVRIWLLLINLPYKLRYAWSMLCQSVLFSLFCISTLHSVIIYGILEMSIALTAIFTLLPTVNFIWSNRTPFPPYSTQMTILVLMFLLLSWWAHNRMHQVVESKKGYTRFQVLAFCLLIPTWFKHTYSHYHPIDLLISEANTDHKAYVRSVEHDKSLSQAVTRYQQKYQQNPPPGFDIWHEYAVNRSTLVIDHYDQIFDDLLPFRTIPPSDLRRQTWEMVSNGWNEVSGITIRNGIASVQENVLPTHRWMLEGVEVLINSFARYLPDMDLAFNLNDESRVAVPFEAIDLLREQGKLHTLTGTDSWSSKRAEGWLPIPEKELTETSFENWSFRNTFAKYGSVGCPPGSRAKTHPHISSQSHFCLECVKPHSIGQFISNWPLAADVCHQPDLAHLHGLYLSPAAFKATYQPMPVFSQSKPHGYNDILYPSAWNYRDKVKYDESSDSPYSQKENILFWRGASSEGFSSGDHTWRGMARQRLVHLVNNLTYAAHDAATILLPDGEGKYKYELISGPDVKDLGLKVDVSFVDHIVRCGGIGPYDCIDQEKEFGLIGPSDFQSHWKYRFLFDLDGAGFSGRFVPFLQSKSLPFKTALFREWYDDRVFAWKHFVPQDLRLHGLWSTLAYFAGVEGKSNGKEIKWQAHEKEAETIAEDGRLWAGLVLRKEDMEVYFFRLLLEWGRLTDDNRDNLGFVIG